MTESSSDADTWRRRERGLGIGVLLWSAAVTTLLTLHPTETLALVETWSAIELGGVLLVSIGVAGAVSHAAYVLVEDALDSSGAELTDVPWEET